MKTLFAHIKSFFTKLFGSTNWERVAVNTLAVVGPLLTTLVTLTAGAPAAALVSKIVATAQSDLQTVSSLVTAVQSGTSTGAAAQLQNLLAGVKANLSSLLTAADVKDPDTQAKVSAIVNTVIEEIDAILGELPTSVTPVTPAPPTVGLVTFVIWRGHWERKYSGRMCETAGNYTRGVRNVRDAVMTANAGVSLHGLSHLKCPRAVREEALTDRTHSWNRGLGTRYANADAAHAKKELGLPPHPARQKILGVKSS